MNLANAPNGGQPPCEADDDLKQLVHDNPRCTTRKLGQGESAHHINILKSIKLFITTRCMDSLCVTREKYACSLHCLRFTVVP